MYVQLYGWGNVQSYLHLVVLVWVGGYVRTTLWLGQHMKLPSLGGVSVGGGYVRTTLWLGQHMKLPSLGGVSVGEGCIRATLWLGQRC